MGEKEKYLDMALDEFRKNDRIRLGKVASYIETEPYGGVEQDVFVNSVCCIETLYSPYDLLDELHRIEQLAERKREIHWGPRTLDLDVLFFEGFVSDDRVLTVPHPDMQNRDFVLKPLLQLSPYYMHPVLHKSVMQMHSELKDR